jgi:hypothetical protein
MYKIEGGSFKVLYKSKRKSCGRGLELPTAVPILVGFEGGRFPADEVIINSKSRSQATAPWFKTIGCAVRFAGG